MEEQEEKKNIPIKETDTLIIETPARDLYTVYMRDKTRLSYAKTMWERYNIYFNLIKNGQKMLPDKLDDPDIVKQQKYADIKKEIDALLKTTEKTEGEQNEKNELYLLNRKVAYRRIERDTSGKLEPIYIYKITSNNSGEIEVETGDLEKGFVDNREQQCQNLIPKLEAIHDKIEEGLIFVGIIDVYNPEPRELVRMFLRKAMQEKQTKEEKRIEKTKDTEKEEKHVSVS